jgi:hypothetical protein
MAQTRTITARDPQTGATFTRRTARTYHAAVVVGDPAQAVAWCGRPELAAKRLAEVTATHPTARLALVVADPWAEPAPAAAESVAEPPAADYLHSAPARAAADEVLAALDELSAEPVAAVRPCLPGEPATAPAPSHGTAAPALPDLKGAPDKIAALEFLAGGGALSSDVWVALGWPFEAFLAWAQRPDADARESALRARIRRDGVAACLAAL